MSATLPVLLAIETSQRRGGVAVRDGGGRLAVEPLQDARRHDDDLLAAIDRAMGGLSLRPADLGAVGVSVGPGGFTGLRIAVSTAKMLAETIGCVLLAVPSALVAADAHGERAPDAHGPLLVALAAKRETFWATRARRAGAAWIVDGEPGLVRPPTVPLDGLTAVIADEYLPDWARRACAEAGLAVHEPCFDPRSTLRVAAAMLEAGVTTDPLQLLPLYPRPPEAVALWAKRGR